MVYNPTKYHIKLKIKETTVICLIALILIDLENPFPRFTTKGSITELNSNIPS